MILLRLVKNSNLKHVIYIILFNCIFHNNQGSKLLKISGGGMMDGLLILRELTK